MVAQVSDLQNANEIFELHQKLREAEDLESRGIENIDGKQVFGALREKYGRKTV